MTSFKLAKALYEAGIIVPSRYIVYREFVIDEEIDSYDDSMNYTGNAKFTLEDLEAARENCDFELYFAPEYIPLPEGWTIDIDKEDDLYTFSVRYNNRLGCRFSSSEWEKEKAILFILNFTK